MADMSRVSTSSSEVYPPSDDSFALVDAVVSDNRVGRGMARRKALGRGGINLVEIGSGSGYVLCSVALSLMEHCGMTSGTLSCIATDINPLAAEATRQTLHSHGVVGEVIETDFLKGLEGRLKGNIDILLFNPPYVVTPPEEVGGEGIVASWAGGERGREVIDRLVPEVKSWMAPGGVFYMVTIEQNEPKELCRWLSELGFDAAVVLVKEADEELLSIVRAEEEEPAGGETTMASV